jgi:hypothetical protein
MSGKHSKNDIAEAEATDGTKKILLVDDSSSSRMAARMLFAHHKSYVPDLILDWARGSHLKN